MRAVITIGGHRVPTLYRQPALACSTSPENKYPGGARGGNALAAVSYTHLDVYKRQPSQGHRVLEMIP